jgi:hypothetical protein
MSIQTIIKSVPQDQIEDELAGEKLLILQKNGRASFKIYSSPTQIEYDTDPEDI